MEAIDFKDSNVKFAENQKEYLTLHALQFNDDYGTVITCWKPTFKERLRIMFGGNIWLSMMTFNKPLTPVNMSANKDELYKIESSEDRIKIAKRRYKFW